MHLHILLESGYECVIITLNVGRGNLVSKEVLNFVLIEISYESVQKLASTF